MNPLVKKIATFFLQKSSGFPKGILHPHDGIYLDLFKYLDEFRPYIKEIVNRNITGEEKPVDFCKEACTYEMIAQELPNGSDEKLRCILQHYAAICINQILSGSDKLLACH